MTRAPNLRIRSALCLGAELPSPIERPIRAREHELLERLAGLRVIR
jgi:hypothetical protein